MCETVLKRVLPSSSLVQEFLGKQLGSISVEEMTSRLQEAELDHQRAEDAYAALEPQAAARDEVKRCTQAVTSAEEARAEVDKRIYAKVPDAGITTILKKEE